MCGTWEGGNRGEGDVMLFRLKTYLKNQNLPIHAIIAVTSLFYKQTTFLRSMRYFDIYEAIKK